MCDIAIYTTKNPGYSAKNEAQKFINSHVRGVAGTATMKENGLAWYRIPRVLVTNITEDFIFTRVNDAALTNAQLHEMFADFSKL